jgi:hypothetical protein
MRIRPARRAKKWIYFVGHSNIQVETDVRHRAAQCEFE